MSMLQKQDIPNEIVEEFNQYYDNIDWKYYDTSVEEIGKELHEQMVSRRLSYQVEYDDHGEHQIVDPNTFQTKTVRGNSTEGFIVRGIFDDENSTMYPWQVLSSGMMVNPLKETEQGDS